MWGAGERGCGLAAGDVAVDGDDAGTRAGAVGRKRIWMVQVRLGAIAVRCRCRFR